MIEHVIHLADAASLSQAHQGALNMAALGIPVFPLWGIKDGKCACGAPEGKCKAGKHPRRLATFKEATTDAAVVDMWFKEAHLNYGVRTGVDINNSGKMLVVVDVDHYKEAGLEPLDALTKRFGALPDTAEVLTGAGGRHLYFMTAIGGDFTDALGENIDFKVNGYVVGPGSLHASGKRYEWEGSSDLFEGHEIADLPQWVIEHFSKRTRLKPLESTVTTEPMSRYEVQRLRYALLAIEPDNYRVWVRIIMALKSTGDEAQAYAIADEWSRRSDKYVRLLAELTHSL